MFRFLIILLVLFWKQSQAVDITVPETNYGSGTIIISASEYSHFPEDTLNFSPYFTSFLKRDGSVLTIMGLPDWLELIFADNVQVFFNADTMETIWSNVKSIPDSTQSIDRLDPTFGNYGIFPDAQFKEVGTHSNSQFPMLECDATNFSIAYNQILYVETQNRNFKLQVSGGSFSTDTCNVPMRPQPYLYNTEMDSIFIKWAVDSAGNGLFKSSYTSTKHNTSYHSTYSARNEKTSYFNILGQKVFYHAKRQSPQVILMQTQEKVKRLIQNHHK